MIFQEGFVYHIDDAYFEKANDANLMRNKESGTYRPTFFCMRDKVNAGLLWVVPMSSRTEKFQAIHDKQKARYGKCLTIVMGEFDGRKAAFLLQNMFPITEKYLDHIHTRNGNPVAVKYSVAQEVYANMRQLHRLIAKGKTVVFPDVNRLEALMLEELRADMLREETKKNRSVMPLTPPRRAFHELATEAKAEADRRNGEKAAPVPTHEKQER